MVPLRASAFLTFIGTLRQVEGDRSFRMIVAVGEWHTVDRESLVGQRRKAKARQSWAKLKFPDAAKFIFALHVHRLRCFGASVIA